MKIFLIFLLMGTINTFLWLLFFRLYVEDDPNQVYKGEGLFEVIVVGFYVLSIITLPIILVAFIYEIIRKYMIALIEFIVAINKNKKE